MNQSDIDATLFEPQYNPRPKPTAIPGAVWNDEPTYCLTVNDEWVSHLLGAMETLDQDDTWLGTDEERAAARDQANEIMAALMEQCENMADRPIRLTAEGLVESRHPDTGDWLLDTTRDPREFIPLNQPLEGTSTVDERKNLAGDALLRVLQENQAATAAGMADTDPITAVTAAMLDTLRIAAGIVQPGDFYEVLATAAAIRMTTIDTTFFTDFFQNDVDNSVWGVFFCALCCHMDDDAAFSVEAWQAAKADILAAYPTLGDNIVISYWFEAVSNLIGRKGFTNGGRLYWGAKYGSPGVWPDDCTCA